METIFEKILKELEEINKNIKIKLAIELKEKDYQIEESQLIKKMNGPRKKVNIINL